MTSTSVSEPLFGRPRLALPSRASVTYLAAGGAAIGIYFLLLLLPSGAGDAQDVWYCVIGASSVTAIFVAARRMEHARLAWNLFGIAISTSVIADGISGFYEMHLDKEPPVPSLTDGFYLVSYPFIFYGIYLLLRDFGPVRSRAAILDALIVAVAAGTVQWIFLVDPYLHTGDKVATRATEIAYPTFDLLMFVALAQIVLSFGGRVVSYELLVLSALLWVIGDEFFYLSVDNYHAGGWVDFFWLASYVGWGAAALDPSAGRETVRDRREVPRLTNARLALLGGALLTVPAVILVEHFWHGHTVHPKSVAIGAAVLSILVVVRFAGLVRAVEGARAAERSANARLRELDRLKDEFVSTVSHELRTPLTSISGYVELARELAVPEARGYLEIVERNADRLLSLVNDLLFVARIQSGGVELDKGDVDATTLVAECVTSARPHAAANNVSLQFKGGGSGTAVYGDMRRLGQVFDNLISNAIKFSPEGGEVDITVSSQNGLVCVRVEDRGIGISAAERSRLFERFFRSADALDRQIPGTGLGLYISKAIVEAHGGEITATSTEGEGSSFVVELPVRS
ncbi:MAG TPA: HAMP domain-containing sensor histidine kinase [Gaiellaceae bacterium]